MLKSNFKSDLPLHLGVLGAGQLAKMLAQEAYKMGLNVVTIDKSFGTPAGDMTSYEFGNGWESNDELDKFIEECDVITLENEFIAPSILEYIERSRPIFPSSKTISLIQDKFIQKQTFENVGIAVPNYREINSVDDAINFGKEFGFPFVLKARKFSYDGYGNYSVRNEEDAKNGFLHFNPNVKIERPLYAEQFVNFTKELAVMVVRSSKNEMKTYPCVETIQKNHICHQVIAPAEIENEYQQKAKDLAIECVKAIDGVGVFGVEMFIDAEGNILVNEIAPRPHNSGHYTIEACYTSQFENGLRAILGLPLGSTEMVNSYAIMINLLGERDGSGVPSNVLDMLKYDKVKLHLYNKKSSRKGRKMGHLTVIGNDLEDIKKEANSAFESLIW
jgi:5-(carboxyamino)imidazole ribonucleotide synthase